MDNDPQTTMLAIGLILLFFMYRFGEAYGRYLELEEQEDYEWEKLESYKASRDFYSYIVLGLLLAIFLVPLFI